MEKERLILLKRIKYSEADLILHGINTQGAKVHLFARAALKSKKRFGGGVLEPFHFVEVLYQRQRSSEEGGLRPINEATLIRDFSGLRSDYSRLQVGVFMLQTVDHWSKEGETEGQALFNLLGQSLKALERVQNIQELKVQFWAKLLWTQGVLERAEEYAPLLTLSVADADQIKIPGAELERLSGLLARHPESHQDPWS